MQTKIYLDEFPLIKEREECLDYSGKIVFTLYGQSLFEEDNLKLIVKGNCLIIATKFRNHQDIEFIFDKINSMRQKRNVIYTFFFKQIQRCVIREGVLEIYLRERSYVYPLLKLLHSYLFYKVNKTDEYYKNKNIIRLENSIKGEKIIFVRQKGMYRNLLDFYLGKVDCTAAHVFRDDFIRLTKKT